MKYFLRVDDLEHKFSRHSREGGNPEHSNGKGSGFPIKSGMTKKMSESERGAHIPVIGDETYGEAIIAYFEEKGISWTPWVFDPVWSPQLIANWNFEPTRQGRFFRDKMMHLNARR
jgi:hypothetical protein